MATLAIGGQIAYRDSSTALADRKHREMQLFAAIALLVVMLTTILVLASGKFGFSNTLAVTGALAAVVVTVRWPVAGMYGIAASAMLVEQDTLPIPNSGPVLYVFSWPVSITGLPDRPIGFLIILVLLALMAHNLLKRDAVLRGGALIVPFAFFMLCVVWGVVHGITGHGDTKIIVNEVRPLWYWFASYLLAYNLIDNRRRIYHLFWLVIVCAGIKGLQGTYIYTVLIHGDLTNHHEIMAHEESFFFCGALLLLILFFLHHRYRPQLWTALAFLPFVLIAMVANQRRADFVALLVGIAAAWVLAFVVKPKARTALAVSAVVVLTIGGAYVAAFGHGTGGFSAPAHAIMSVIHPDATDQVAQQSDLYRVIENYDLKYTVKLNPLGLGFGKPFLQPIPLPNILALDPVYNVIPHNSVYWIWMRLGAPGYLALWLLFGAIIVRGSIIAKSLKDPYLQMAAIWAVSVTLVEIVVAFSDYQLYFLRNVVYFGILAGMLVKLPALDKEREAVSSEHPRRFAK